MGLSPFREQLAGFERAGQLQCPHGPQFAGIFGRMLGRSGRAPLSQDLFRLLFAFKRGAGARRFRPPLTMQDLFQACCSCNFERAVSEIYTYLHAANLSWPSCLTVWEMEQDDGFSFFAREN